MIKVMKRFLKATGFIYFALETKKELLAFALSLISLFCIGLGVYLFKYNALAGLDFTDGTYFYILGAVFVILVFILICPNYE